MKSNYSSLMQSKFFNPAFNSAIFDGPVRIYFAQLHESLALKIYFKLQKEHAETVQKAKELSKRLGHNFLIMVYPNLESFQFAFEASALDSEYAIDQHLGDQVIGLRNADENADFSFLGPLLNATVNEWQEQLSLQPTPLPLAEI